MTRRHLAAVFVVVGLAAACGAEGRDDEITSGRDSTTSTVTVAPRPARIDDRPEAAAASDIPPSSAPDLDPAPIAEHATPAPDTSAPAPSAPPPPPPPSASPSQSPPPNPPPSPAPPPPPPVPTVPVRDLPPWTGHAEEIGPDLAQAMTGVSWHEGCPVPLHDLRLVHLDHVGFDGQRHRGRLVVHADAVDAVLGAFRRMYDARFPIERVTLVDEAGGDDDIAMAANLTTAFNCRRVTGGSGWSEHATGRALDINPVQNPYVSSRGMVLPPAGSAHTDRSVPAVGLIVEGGPAVAAFDAVGWQWGGRWRTIKDYQHFSASGR